MRLQNSLALMRAHHLHTVTSPKIYFRPYLLLPEQVGLIETQVAETQAQIDVDEHGTILKRRDSPETDVRPEEGDKEVVDENIRDSRSVSPKGDESMEEERQ